MSPNPGVSPNPNGRPLNLGLLGCADVAVRRILPALAGLPGIRLAAVASRTLAKAEAVTARFGGVPVEGYGRLLARPDVDAVYLPLPPGLHADWIARALAAGKHVLAEKPLTTSPEATADLVARARAAGVVLRENFMFVYHARHRVVRGLLAEGAIGTLRAFSATFAIPPRPHDDIRYRRDLGGGALLDVAGYPVRAALFFLGLDLTVAGASLHHDDRLGVDVSGGALLRRPDGVTAHLTFGMEHAYVSSYEIVGSTGRIGVDHAFTTPATHRPVVRLDWQDRTELRNLPAGDQVANALAAFARAVRTGAGTDDETTTTQARLIDDMRRCASREAAHHG